MSKKSQKYIVVGADNTGGTYLVISRSPTTKTRYRWAKCARREAAVLTYDAARKAASNYYGRSVRA